MRPNLKQVIFKLEEGDFRKLKVLSASSGKSLQLILEELVRKLLSSKK